MQRTTYYPLRTKIGRALPISSLAAVRKIFESPVSRELAMDYEVALHTSLNDITISPRYSQYLPEIVTGSRTLEPGEGMDTFPRAGGDAVFLDPAPVLSLFAWSSQAVTVDRSKELAVRFHIALPGQFLVGGIAFAGFPFVPWKHGLVVSDGTNSGNFGLPREVRLTCGSHRADATATSDATDFLDADISSTQQEIVSHSGLHVLCTDPTVTNSLVIHLADFPLIQRRLQGSAARVVHGFVIPRLHVFEYREGTRYRPRVRAGLLGATTNVETLSAVPMAAVSVDYRHDVLGGATSKYYRFSASSILGPQRTFTIGGQKFIECFISTPVPPGRTVTLYVAQAEEEHRCIAGIKMLVPFVPETALDEDLRKFTDLLRESDPSSPDLAALAAGMSRSDLEQLLRDLLRIPDGIDFCEHVGIRVYELDPPEGVSPMSLDLGGRYATLLADRAVTRLSDIALVLGTEGIRFVRPTNSRYLAIELTNLDVKAGQFVLRGLTIVQSAHVSMHARAARTQQLKALHFRLMGPGLADDYSSLGPEGFNFSVERVVAGQRTNVLFRANSLLDLLHAGAAKCFSNSRRRSVEFEKTEHGPAVKELMDEPSVDQELRYSETRLSGWRRSSTGEGVEQMVRDTPEWDWYKHGAGPSPNGITKFPGAFESYANQETRAHVQHLYPNTEPWLMLKTWYNVLVANGKATVGMEPTLPFVEAPFVDSGFPGWYWRGITLPPLDGLRQIVASPSSMSLEEFVAANPATPPDLKRWLTLAINRPRVLKIVLFGGANTTVAQLGLMPIPLLTHNAAVGSQGTVTRQASKTGFTHAQHLSGSLDEGRNYSRFESGEIKRLITRREVPGSDRQRIRGAEVAWQGEVLDIITGSVPLDFALPATAGKVHFRTADDSLRVRFGGGIGRSIMVDFWFDLTEEMLKDDY